MENSTKLHIRIAEHVANLLYESGVPQDACTYIFDRLADGLSGDSPQNMARLEALLDPHNSGLIAIKDGRITSPKEPGSIIYRRV